MSNNLSLPKNYHKYLKHLTTTGYVLNPEKTKVLLIYHKKLTKWLPPGGHVDMGEMPHEAVLREIKEETGITAQFLWENTITTLNKKKEWLIPSPYLTMLQLIPTIKTEEEHLHYDFSYILIAKNTKLKKNVKEIDKVGWFSYEELLHLDTFTIVPEICKSVLIF